MYHDGAIKGLTIDLLDLSDPCVFMEAEALVAGHAQATPFHRPAWGRAVAKATGNAAHCLVARRSDGTCAGLLPLHHIRSRLFGDALVSSGFAVDGGILADAVETAEALGDAAWTLAERLGVGSVELRGGAAPGTAWHLEENSHLGFARPLAGDEEAELARLPRKHRAEVRKGLANGALSVEVGLNDRLLKAHYTVYSESVRNLGTPVLPAALMRETAKAFGDDADILLVKADGRPVAAVLSFYHRGAVMPFWGGGLQAARGLRANEIMYFRLMEHARNRGCHTFDFGRSRVGSGQSKWKQSWGFDPRPLGYWRRAADGQARDISPDSDKYARKVALWKKLPLPVANLVGPVLSRGLG